MRAIHWILVTTSVAALAASPALAQMETIEEYGYEAPDRGLKEDAYSHHSGDFCQFIVTREAGMPSALTEFLFLSNDQDATVLNDDRSLQLLSKHLAEAIDTFVADHYGR